MRMVAPLGRGGRPPLPGNSQVLARFELRLHRTRRRFRRRAGAGRLLLGATGGRSLRGLLGDGGAGGFLLDFLFFRGHVFSFLQISLKPTRRLTTAPAACAAASTASRAVRTPSPSTVRSTLMAVLRCIS